MKTVIFCCLFVLMASCIISCSKSSGSPQGDAQGSNLIGKWSVVNDTIANVNNYYFLEGGIGYEPDPGNYIGSPADYYDFRSTGIVYVHENGFTDSSGYQLIGDTILVIPAKIEFDSASIISLTANSATIRGIQHSPNGGQITETLFLKK
jgi:hypothetical protein